MKLFPECTLYKQTDIYRHSLKAHSLACEKAKEAEVKSPAGVI